MGLGVEPVYNVAILANLCHASHAGRALGDDSSRSTDTTNHRAFVSLISCMSIQLYAYVRQHRHGNETTTVYQIESYF